MTTTSDEAKIEAKKLDDIVDSIADDIMDEFKSWKNLMEGGLSENAWLSINETIKKLITEAIPDIKSTL